MLVLVINKLLKFVFEVLVQYGIVDFFVDVIGGDMFLIKKFDLMVFNWLLDKYQMIVSDMLMVGDFKNDILVVKNVGCFLFGLIYGYNYGEFIFDLKLDYVVDCIDQLFDLVLVFV